MSAAFQEDVAMSRALGPGADPQVEMRVGRTAGRGGGTQVDEGGEQGPEGGMDQLQDT